MDNVILIIGFLIGILSYCVLMGILADLFNWE